jgi:hypothetical protein
VAALRNAGIPKPAREAPTKALEFTPAITDRIVDLFDLVGAIRSATPDTPATAHARAGMLVLASQLNDLAMNVTARVGQVQAALVGREFVGPTSDTPATVSVLGSSVALRASAKTLPIGEALAAIAAIARAPAGAAASAAAATSPAPAGASAGGGSSRPSGGRRSGGDAGNSNSTHSDWGGRNSRGRNQHRYRSN